MLFFDAQGYLTPYDLIPTEWSTFIDAFGWNPHRLAIIESLRLFIGQLTGLSINSFELWIDGSFVTHKERPNDVDIVLFLPTSIYWAHEQSLRSIRSKFANLDLYFVRRIDQAQSDYFLYQSDRAEWLFQFTMTRPDRLTQRKFPKGFLQIMWTNESTF